MAGFDQVVQDSIFHLRFDAPKCLTNGLGLTVILMCALSVYGFMIAHIELDAIDLVGLSWMDRRLGVKWTWKTSGER